MNSVRRAVESYLKSTDTDGGNTNMGKKFSCTYLYMKVIYIDAQNLHLGTKEFGWILDYEKFYRYLKKKFWDDIIVKIFFGYIQKFEWLYTMLKSIGYTLVYKTTSIKSDGSLKGNVDIDIAIEAISDRFTNWLQFAVVVSSDCDFISLFEYFQKHNIQHDIIVTHNRVSKVLREHFNKTLLCTWNLKFFLEKENPNLS